MSAEITPRGQRLEAHDRQARLEVLDSLRLELARQRTEAMRVWDQARIMETTEGLNAVYPEYRAVRAEVEAGGRTDPVLGGRKKREALTVIPEIVADPLAIFVRQCCRLRPDAVTRAVDLKASYKQWAVDVKAEPMSPHAITKRLLRMQGVSEFRSHGRRLYRGIEVLNSQATVEGVTSCKETEAMRILEVR